MTKTNSRVHNNFKYQIILDLEKDADNWYGGCNAESFGVDWKMRVSEDVYNNINGKSKKESFKFLLPFLKQKYINEKQNIDNRIIFLENIYKEKFDKACKKVASLTGKDLYLNNFTIFITTFPRGPYNFGKGYMWEYIGWNNPIAGFMHELLHFQFHHYWRDDPNSSISKLSENQFQYLKESLTVILDDDIVPLIEYPDKGYDIHQKFRKELHDFWKTNHDFNKLVDFGLKILPKYICTTIDNPKANFKQFKTPLDLLDFMDANITYGFVGKNGKKYIDQNKDWQKNWESECIVQSGNGLLKTKCGTCWDQVELERKWFFEHGYQFKTIFSWFEINKPNNYPTHTFLAYKENDKWYWFEHAFTTHRGIREFNSLVELISDVKAKQLKSAVESGVANPKDKKMIKAYAYKEPRSNLCVGDYIDHVIKGTLVE